MSDLGATRIEARAISSRVSRLSRHHATVAKHDAGLPRTDSPCRALQSRRLSVVIDMKHRREACRSSPCRDVKIRIPRRRIDLGVTRPLPSMKCRNAPQSLHLPLPVEAREAGLAGEELLHGGLLEVALLGDEPVQPAQQRIHIAQRRRDGALFAAGRMDQVRRSRSNVIPAIVAPCCCERVLASKHVIAADSEAMRAIRRDSCIALSERQRDARLDAWLPAWYRRRATATRPDVLRRSRSAGRRSAALAVSQRCRLQAVLMYISPNQMIRPSRYRR